jgi:hypothetical protein
LSVDIVVSRLAEYAVNKVVDVSVINALVESVGDVIVGVLVEYDVVEAVEITAYDEVIGSVIELVGILLKRIVGRVIEPAAIDVVVRFIVGVSVLLNVDSLEVFAVKAAVVETVVEFVVD